MARKKIGNEWVDVHDSQIGNNPNYGGTPVPAPRSPSPPVRGGRLPKEPGAFVDPSTRVYKPPRKRK